MAVSVLKTFVNAPQEKVWELVTDPENYGWRSDIEKTVIISPERFEEHTPGGYVTRFAVTRCEPCERWEMDMENSNMTGHWTGLFRPAEGGTEIEFTEDVTVKKIIMKPFVKGYLKKQQETFARDLKKAAERKE
ncbi:MAG: SRPBCC family protein [Ruminococcus sp.]|nr:SRPBCC family protein [Ruminococcus sp.]